MGSYKRKHFVYSAKDFVNAAASSSVKTFEISPSDLQLRYQDLNLSNIFSDSEAMAGIKQQHFLEVIGGSTKSCKLSKTEFAKAKPAEDVQGMGVEIGEWVLVEYDGQFYPGEVRAIQDLEYLVRVMIPAGKYWKWPENIDEIYYAQDNIKSKLSAPDVVNSRGHFSFIEMP